MSHFNPEMHTCWISRVLLLSGGEEREGKNWEGREGRKRGEERMREKGKGGEETPHD